MPCRRPSPPPGGVWLPPLSIVSLGGIVYHSICAHCHATHLPSLERCPRCRRLAPSPSVLPPRSSGFGRVHGGAHPPPPSTLTGAYVLRIEVTDGATVTPLVATAPTATAALMGGPAAALEGVLAAAAGSPAPTGSGGSVPRDAALTALDAATAAALTAAPVLLAVGGRDVTAPGLWGREVGAGKGDGGGAKAGKVPLSRTAAAPPPPPPPPLAAVRPGAAVVAARLMLVGAPTPLGVLRSRLGLPRGGAGGEQGGMASIERRVGEGTPAAAGAAGAPPAADTVAAVTPRRPPPPPGHGAPPSGGGGRLFRVRLGRALRLAVSAPAGSATAAAAAASAAPASPPPRRVAAGVVSTAPRPHSSPPSAAAGTWPAVGGSGGEGGGGGKGSGEGDVRPRRRRSATAGTPGRPHGGRRRRLASPPRSWGSAGTAPSQRVVVGGAPAEASPPRAPYHSGMCDSPAGAVYPLHATPVAAAAAADSPARIAHLLGTDAAAAAAFWSPTWARPSAAAAASEEADAAAPVAAPIPPAAAVPSTREPQGRAEAGAAAAVPQEAGVVATPPGARRGAGAASATPPVSVDAAAVGAPVRQALQFG